MPSQILSWFGLEGWNNEEPRRNSGDRKRKLPQEPETAEKKLRTVPPSAPESQPAPQPENLQAVIYLIHSFCRHKSPLPEYLIRANVPKVLNALGGHHHLGEDEIDTFVEQCVGMTDKRELSILIGGFLIEKSREKISEVSGHNGTTSSFSSTSSATTSITSPFTHPQVISQAFKLRMPKALGWWTVRTPVKIRRAMVLIRVSIQTSSKMISCTDLWPSRDKTLRQSPWLSTRH